MDSTPSPPQHDDAWRRAIAGFALHARLAGRHIPDHVAGIPDRMFVDRLARMDAKELLAFLQEIYGVAWWDRKSFERAFVAGALEGWRPGSLLQHAPGGLRVVSTSCPIGAEVEKDPRLCQACQSIQKHAAYLALIGQVEGVGFDRLISKGASSCEMNVKFRPERPRRT